MIQVIREVNVIGVEEGRLFDDFVSFCENMVNQNRIVLIAALLSTHKLNGFKEIFKLLSKGQRMGLMNAVCDFCRAKIAKFSRAKNENRPLNTIYVVVEETFVFIKKVLLQYGINKMNSCWKSLISQLGSKCWFFFRYTFEIFSDRHQLSESSFQCCDPIKI